MPLYSHSKLSTFEQCRQKYKFQYIDKIRTEAEGVEAFLGKRVHEALEKLYAELKFKTATIDDLKAFYDDLWQKNWSENVVIVRKDRKEEDYRKLGFKCVEDYYKRYHPFDSGRVLGLEKRVDIDLDGSGRYKVWGFIDRLMETEDGHYESHDYKTAGHLPSQAELDSDRQQALYEIGIRQNWKDVKEVDLVWHFVTFDKEMRSKREPGELEALKGETIRLIDEIEATEDYPPKQSNLCRWCDYQDICPLFGHKIKTDALAVNEYLKDDGVTLVNKYVSLEAKKKEFKAEIDDLEAKQENIKEAAIALAEKEKVTRLYGSDNVLNIKDDIRVNYPRSNDKRRADFARQLNEMGLWEVVTDLKWGALKTIAKKEKWTQSVPDELKDFVSIEQTKKVALAKRKDD